MRASSSSSGASRPICEYVGRIAISSEPPHIITTEITSEVLRPRRSAILPNIQPPMGRIRKPIAKTAAACSNCTASSDFGKNEGAK